STMSSLLSRPPSPPLFPYTTLFRSDLTIALMAFLGGFGTLSGPIFGALLLEPYLGYAQFQVSNAYVAEGVLGALFLVVIIFLPRDRKSTRLNSSHEWISYAVFCLKK